MFRTLGDIMNMKGPANMVEEDLKQMVRDSIKQFVEDFNTQGPFIDYFKTYWEKKIGEFILCFVSPHVCTLNYDVFSISSFL